MLPGVLLAGALGLPRWFVVVPPRPPGQGVPQRIPECARRHRARRQVRPAAERRHPADRHRKSPEPVRTEFRRIVEAQQIGMSIPEAAMRMPETMPCPEAGFFGIVIQIQQQAGGNLSEALGNLSRVLRDRKKMKAKVQALSMEAKASAVIIGALPFIVAFLVYLSSPNYIMPLFTTSAGHLILGVSGVWMSIGIFVMRKMMNFECLRAADRDESSNHSPIRQFLIAFWSASPSLPRSSR